MRLIDSDALQTALVDEYSGIADYQTRQEFYKAIEIAKKQPTIDPVKRGEWIEQRYIDEPVICSVCKECPDGAEMGSDVTGSYNFCPNCGADMKEEKEKYK